ncbi:hypothetical protein QO002_006068 [Pararhizobium capsulatum DSM 1112]|uniref:Uncharacterized protein n=1 Tax=Pararhizobium capsulatum DSM 1112 TaxID=1121113 RepID=A0ABU0C024_9HYPH|nr:hypothetical protein [Pararhizobium capsulatum DSM 1112]
MHLIQILLPFRPNCGLDNEFVSGRAILTENFGDCHADGRLNDGFDRISARFES